MQHCNLAMLMAMTLTMKTTSLTAAETNAMTAEKASDNGSTAAQPSAAFLEFLGSMTEIDGKMTDALHMIEMTENEILDSSATDTEKAAETKIDTTEDLNSDKIMKNNQPNDETTAKENR